MRKVLTSLVIFVLTFFVFSVAKISAKVIKDETGTVNIPKTEILNDDLFVSAQTLEIDGVVNGDVFAAAQTVRISGVVNGNLHIGGQFVSIPGTVKGNVYCGAQDFSVSAGKIGGSILVGAQNVNIDKSSTVGGSVLVGAGFVSINSQVGRSVYAGAGSLTVGESAVIGKDLYYAAGSPEQANISGSAKITGNTYKAESNIERKNIEAVQAKAPAIFRTARVLTELVAFAGALIVGFLCLKFFNKTFTETSKFVAGSFWKSLGIGFVVTLAFIPGIIILLITVIGIPLAGLAFLLLLLYMYLAKIVIGLCFGNWLVRGSTGKKYRFSGYLRWDFSDYMF
jgi:cytoskeletal protein CcmA (bactofilin family)